MVDFCITITQKHHSSYIGMLDLIHRLKIPFVSEILVASESSPSICLKNLSEVLDQVLSVSSNLAIESDDLAILLVSLSGFLFVITFQ